jgi:hypothetical protein
MFFFICVIILTRSTKKSEFYSIWYNIILIKKMDLLLLLTLFNFQGTHRKTFKGNGLPGRGLIYQTPGMNRSL